MIIVSGMAGTKKAEVSQLLGTAFNGNVYSGNIYDRALLEKAYTSSEKELTIHRYPFLLQLQILQSRVEIIKQLNGTQSKRGIFVKSIYEDWYHAKLYYKLNLISSLEFRLYEQLWNQLNASIEEIKARKPILNVYLKSSFEHVIQRILDQGESFEKYPDMMNYYYELWSGYDDWLLNFYDASDFLVIHVDKVDLNKPQDAQIILQMVSEQMN